MQALSHVTHLLDSTLMASHSSVMGVVGLIEQLGVLRSVIGGIVGLKWLSQLVLGRRRTPGISADEFTRRSSTHNTRHMILLVMALAGVYFAARRMRQLATSNDDAVDQAADELIDAKSRSGGTLDRAGTHSKTAKV